MKNCRKNILKSRNGITLIALVITIIVLLILAGISISMLAGDNSILSKATDAKIKTETESQREQIQIEVLGSYGTDGKINIANLKTSLESKGYTVSGNSLPMTVTVDEKEYIIDANGDVISNTTIQERATIGENYHDNWIGKTIDYTSGSNNVTEWIILGKQTSNGKNDILITTKNPVSTQQINYTMAEWVDYTTKINNACKAYVGETGILGTKAAIIKGVRSITLEDINNAVGFTPPETFDEFTFGSIQNFANKQVNYYYPDETNKVWINPMTSETTWKHLNDAYYYYDGGGGTYYYNSAKNGYNDVSLTSSNLSKQNNMLYILCENIGSYWVASRSVDVHSVSASFEVSYVGDGRVYSNGEHVLCYSRTGVGGDNGGSDSIALRPVVVLSNEISWEDVKDLIGGYAGYME